MKSLYYPRKYPHKPWVMPLRGHPIEPLESTRKQTANQPRGPRRTPESNASARRTARITGCFGQNAVPAFHCDGRACVLLGGLTERNLTFAVLLSLTLAGCATAYQPNGYTGGFSETRYAVDYAVDIVQVTFEGNGRTSRERASDLSMLRSAELTLQSGYRYFIVLAGDVQSTAYSFTTPTRTVTTGTVQTYGNAASVNAQT